VSPPPEVPSSPLCAGDAGAAGSTAIDDTLHQIFGFRALRAGQGEIIDDVLAGHQVVAVMPTGAGKSLCYQLPAVLLAATGGVSLVVSPLIALMKDQVDALASRGVRAAALTSAVGPGEQREILDGVRAGFYSLVYVAPERFRSPRFLEALDQIGDRLALMAIDEAHCISEWGHDFRPDYRRLGQAVGHLAPRRLIALTATATPEVRADIAAQLGMQAPRYHVRGFDRPNLCWMVEPCGGPADKGTQASALARRASEHGSALVYAATRKNAERYAEALGKSDLRVRAYHAGLSDELRHEVQDAFMSGALDAIVATNAFGMGVDKADVRVVVHADLPRSPEAYYQEAGRAGRDGQPADCVLLFNHGDVRLQEFLIDASFPQADVLRALWKLLRQSPHPAQATDGLRDALPGAPHASTISSALRLLERHGLAVLDGELWRGSRPEELGGDFPPLCVDSLARRAAVERSKLRQMVDYAYHTGCRRQYILAYFGDADSHQPEHRCTGCDNCRGTGKTAALGDAQKLHAQVLLALAGELRGRFGRTRLVELARGEDDDERLLGIPGRGLLRGESQRQLLDLVRALEGAGLLETSRGEYPTVQLSRRGKDVVAGRLRLDDMTLPLLRRGGKSKGSGARTGAARTPQPTELPADLEVCRTTLARLRALRGELAAEHGVPAYVIFSNRTLQELAARKPRTSSELAAIHGIGKSRIEAYGPAILDALRAADDEAAPS
jgi:ATP-dependent DNA helicase RecQ